MESTSLKRPTLVWVIMIWFCISGFLAIYKFYSIATGTAVLPEYVERPTGVFYYLQAFGFQVFSMAAAIFLFLKMEVAKWLFVIFLGSTAISITYTILLGGLPEQHKTTIIIVMLATLLIYSLITKYTFSLKSKGYYDNNT